MAADPSSVRVYTVNGATAGSSSSLPDWLTRKREAKGKKRTFREHVEGTLELIQGFEFPEASNKIKTTRDGHHAIATGTYKPQMRIWDLDQLSLKFERHSDAENVDFVILSDDWTKTIHLQNDRTVELHTQGGFHYRTRIPRFGRSLAYHFPSCDAYLGATGNEVYRLNLEQGRFMNPLILDEKEDGEIIGVNVVDVNPVHQLLAFGIDGNGTAQLWDPRSRTSVGVLRLPRSRLMPVGLSDGSLSVTAIASRVDGLSYAIGTSTGHTLLYDIRAAHPFSLKDQGYGLPIKTLSWIDGNRIAGGCMVLSADKKVIKIWDRSTPAVNFTSVTSATDLNDVHLVPGSGLIMTANEGIQMATFYIPQLGPAPRWASFLENITEEMEDQTKRSVYQDFKFVERGELKTLGLDHLIGTPALKPYMHGYFLSLKLYDTARVIANPFAYDEHREKIIKEKMEKMAESRIRTKKHAGVKVNKALAEKLLREEEKTRKKKERHKTNNSKRDSMDTGVEISEEEEKGSRPKLLDDPRFSKIFEDPAFAIDENSKEFGMLNPSAAAQKPYSGDHMTMGLGDAEETGGSSSSGYLTGSESSEELEDTSDSSAEERASEKRRLSPKRGPRVRRPNVPFVPMQPHTSGLPGRSDSATFGQRRLPGTISSGNKYSGKYRETGDAPKEISWIPSTPSEKGEGFSQKNSKSSSGNIGKEKKTRVETFGAGLEKGGEETMDIAESERDGRTRRRQNIRSGSKNAFRRL